ncbi:hypothetical protein [Myxococcus phage Mx1]|nr:hypothetical protein [Myxococcus phage Mx1]
MPDRTPKMQTVTLTQDEAKLLKRLLDSYVIRYGGVDSRGEKVDTAENLLHKLEALDFQAVPLPRICDECGQQNGHDDRCSMKQITGPSTRRI